MLLQLMEEIRNGGTLETASLARKLNTTLEMISALIDHLRRNGFLKVYETCADTCEGCSLIKMCDAHDKKKESMIWEYSEN